jgi:hypothetical protein
VTGWLPRRGLLLHIGPHKTGTTAIQGALQAARPELARHGVIYPGSGRQHRMPALAVTNSRGVSGMREARMVEWERLVADVQAARRKRVVVSSEAFVEANDTVAATIVEQLGGDRVNVVVTLRPLARILPSAWQQLVRNHLCATYDEWLETVLNHSPDRPSTRNFWHRHRHEAVVERWMSILGLQWSSSTTLIGRCCLDHSSSCWPCRMASSSRPMSETTVGLPGRRPS